jgi:uncharacterized SAM-binding protein YcdF (DUF218 family)
VVLLLGLAALERGLAHGGNTNAARVDAIIVLGARLDPDGHPTPVLLSRVTEGVREYERGVASHLIMTGMDSNGFPQAAVMAQTAEAQGVPASAIVQEPRATDTIENACLSERIMKERGWQTAEVVTSPSHLQRSNLVFSRFPLQWRGHAAPPLSSAAGSWYDGPLEVLKTARYITYAQWTESCRP